MLTNGSRIRKRSHSPPSPLKKAKVANVTDSFVPGLLDKLSVRTLRKTYAAATPFKHSVIDKIFDDSLLRKVKDEILHNIHFTEKETDIYKVWQTGDLASLSYLQLEQLALFPSLSQLRDALYSPEFRSFLRAVTGCGHLSGKKQDMSINSYKKGCHLLNHDDVIGSRRVSYILYLPLPVDEPWNPQFGGALELYPTFLNSAGTMEPTPTPSRTIPPSWNQFVFFEVQPGKSFHSVQEVVVPSGMEARERLSISGWFHKPQEGEDGYEPEVVSAEASSLEQLSSHSTSLTRYPNILDPTSLPESLTQEEIKTLSDFLNPVYISPPNIKKLAKRFANESSIELHAFLRSDLANSIQDSICKADRDDGYAYASRGGRVPAHESGIKSCPNWAQVGPPHKHRYCMLTGALEPSQVKSTGCLTLDALQGQIKRSLMESAAFRSWLRVLSSYVPMAHSVQIRRFRPGLDYTLAQAELSDARLDGVLHLTPSATVDSSDVWASGLCGGWDCYMAPHEGDEDPTVYKQGNANAAVKAPGNDGSDELEDDSALLVSQPSFNKLLLVLRDAGVLRFVKYVSAEAPGSRWDICGEWEIADIVEDGGSEALSHSHIGEDE